jgi:Histidine kinase
MFNKLTQGGWLTHVFFVTLFLIVPTIAFVRPPGEPFFSLTRVFVQDTTANFVLLCFFYLNYYILLPKYFFKHQYLQYFVFIILFLAVAFALPHFVGNYFPDVIMGHGDKQFPPPPSFSPADKKSFSLATFILDEFRRHLALFFTAIFFSFLLRTREHLAALKEDKLSAELSSLRAQINPHFLFNTLNSIYALSVKKDAKASEAIINLSGLMRYVIKDANDNKIALQKEIDYIGNYVELQKARLGNTAAVYFEVTGTCGSKQITPLILITYIENAFKYGVNPDADESVVEVKIDIANNGLRMFVFNKIVPLAESINSTGIGITNTAERLKLLYPGKHSIDIKETIATYSVTLSLELV